MLVCRFLLHLLLTAGPTIHMLIIGAPFFRVKVRIPIVSSVPDTILERVGRHLEGRFGEAVLRLFILQLHRAETNVV